MTTAATVWSQAGVGVTGATAALVVGEQVLACGLLSGGRLN